MSLAQDVALVGSGSLIVNRIAAPISSIRTLATQLSVLTPLISVAGDAQTALVAQADFAEPKHLAQLAKLPTAMPVLQSVYSLDIRLGATTPEQAFTGYFSNLNGAESNLISTKNLAQSTLDSLAVIALTFPSVTGTGASALVSLMATVPPSTIEDTGSPGTQIPNPDYTSFLSTHSVKLTNMSTLLNTLKTTTLSMTTTLGTMYTAIDTHYQTGLNRLKGAALVQFLNASHPASVQTEIDNYFNLLGLPTIP